MDGLAAIFRGQKTTADLRRLISSGTPGVLWPQSDGQTSCSAIR
uniref:Si:dkey-79d12.6 n=1 Tax=Astyanax mexicanus TaxID=7994 RepID=A0A3B1KJ01_ASTMX